MQRTLRNAPPIPLSFVYGKVMSVVIEESWWIKVIQCIQINLLTLNGSLSQALFVDNFYSHHARWFLDLNFIVYMYIRSQSSLSNCMGSHSNWDHWNCLLLVTVILLLLVNYSSLQSSAFLLPHAERKSRFLVKQRNLMEDFCSLAQWLIINVNSLF